MKIVRLEKPTEWPPRGELSREELKEAYALSGVAFTAEDLQRFTEPDDGSPMERLLLELEGTQPDEPRIV
jgi:hypothetical protein